MMLFFFRRVLAAALGRGRGLGVWLGNIVYQPPGVAEPTSSNSTESRIATNPGPPS
jgi:hypothetical protein